MAPTRTITNVLVGPATLYLGPEAEAMPADSVMLGGDWGANWMHPGYTDEGLTFNFERDTEMHRVEEQSSPAVVTVNESELMIAVAFAEDTLENMKFAYGGGTITETAAGSGQIGKKTLRLSDQLEVLALGFEGKNPQGFYRRVYIPRVVSVGSVETPYRRSDSKRMYPAEFQAICAIEDIQIVDMTAEATA